MPGVTEDAAATAQPETTADTSMATQGSEPANPSTSDAGTVAAPQQVTQPDATTTGSLQNPIRRSDPPDSVVQKVTPPVPPVAKPETPVMPPAKPLQQPLPEETWQKRFNDTQPFLTRLQQENQQYRQKLEQWQGLDPQQVREQLQLQQQQAQLAKLNPWNRDHPEHSRFRGLRDKLKAQYELANELPHEQRGDAIQRINARVSDGDRRALEDYRSWREAEDAMTPEERDDRFREMATQVFQSKLAEYEQFQQTKLGTQQFLQSNTEVLEKHRDAVLWGMNHPARREVGIRLAQLEEENEKLRQRAVNETQEVETARARDAITKQRATVRRDAASAVVSDPAGEAAKLGLRGDAAFDFIAKHHRTQQ